MLDISTLKTTKTSEIKLANSPVIELLGKRSLNIFLLITLKKSRCSATQLFCKNYLKAIFTVVM